MTQKELFQTATLSQPDTPVSHFHLPGSAEAQKMTDISGHTFFPLFKPNDPLSAFSRMFMGTSLWASTKCFLTWKGKATPQGRSLFQLVPLTLRTDETDFGLSEEMWPTPRACTAMAAENIQNRANDKFPNLESVVAKRMWPTPDTRGFCNEGSMKMLAKKASSKAEFDGMAYRGGNKEKFWPTPQASDNRDRGCMEDPSIQRRIKIGKQIGLTTAVKEKRGSGSLNPQWVEWLMGYPEGWTDLEG